MEVFNKIALLRKEITLKKESAKVGFVPTMGALHKGHISLIRQAKQMADYVLVSIYVNPTQFGSNKDFCFYPRKLKEDLLICQKEGVDGVFTPTDREIYHPKKHFSFNIDVLSNELCGITHPYFFPGIVLIITKLLNIIQPNFIFLGQKDIQQYKIIEKLLIELNYDILPILVPTVREKDGLALSSRNKYLSQKERRIAPMFYQSLRSIFNAMNKENDTFYLILEKERECLTQSCFEVEYLNLYHYNTLLPYHEYPKQWGREKKIIIAGATLLGSTRLIDNIIFPDL